MQDIFIAITGVQAIYFTDRFFIFWSLLQILDIYIAITAAGTVYFADKDALKVSVSLIKEKIKKDGKNTFHPVP
jgi:uncharacterized membrane protein